MSLFRAFNLSVLGESHLKMGKPCQDYSLSSYGGEYAVAIVCDGHGGNKHFRSEIGSRIAAQETLNSIHDLMKERFRKNWIGIKINDIFTKDPDSFLKQLAGNIIFRWREKVQEDFLNHPFSQEETNTLMLSSPNKPSIDDSWISVYGTTLIAVVVSRKFWFGLQIGDGKCVSVNQDGSCSQPIPWDDNCFLNVTTSLCDSDSLSRFRYFFENDKLPIAVFLGTDGIDDTFGTDDSLYDFYLTFLKMIKDKGLEPSINEMQNYLPRMSAKGSQDDMSLAAIILNN